MTYAINQYPKFRTDGDRELSKDQLFIRKNKDGTISYGAIQCNVCNRILDKREFYIRNKMTGLRRRECRDCLMRKMNVIEIGKKRFSQEIYKKGFKRCTVCKDIRHISDFSHDKNRWDEMSPTCRECIITVNRQWRERRKLK